MGLRPSKASLLRIFVSCFRFARESAGSAAVVVESGAPPREIGSLGRPRGDTAERILATVKALVAREGVDGLRLADVGAALGISAPAIYAHFPGGRGELIDRIAQDGVRAMKAFFP